MAVQHIDSSQHPFCSHSIVFSGRIERLDFRGERENQMRDGIMSVSRHYTMSFGHGTPPGDLSAWISAVNAETRCAVV